MSTINTALFTAVTRLIEKHGLEGTRSINIYPDTRSLNIHINAGSLGDDELRKWVTLFTPQRYAAGPNVLTATLDLPSGTAIVGITNWRATERIPIDELSDKERAEASSVTVFRDRLEVDLP